MYPQFLKKAAFWIGVIWVMTILEKSCHVRPYP